MPPHAWFLSNEQRCSAVSLWEVALSQGAPYRLPVMHTVHRDWCKQHACTDPHFYHLGSGCSDLFLRVPSNDSIVVARNRLDAVVQLYALKRHTQIDEAVVYVGRIIGGGCGLNASAYVDLWRELKPCAMAAREQRGEARNVAVSQARCVHEERRAIGALNEHLLSLMRELRVDTAVLLNEAPGGEHIGFRWKTEIVRLFDYPHEHFHDADDKPCDPWYRSHATCTFCTLRTPLSSIACRGWANPDG